MAIKTETEREEREIIAEVKTVRMVENSVGTRSLGTDFGRVRSGHGSV